MIDKEIGPGIRVRVVELKEDPGLKVGLEYFEARLSKACGWALGYVPNHDQKALYVQHVGTKVVAAYLSSELEPII